MKKQYEIYSAQVTGVTKKDKRIMLGIFIKELHQVCDVDATNLVKNIFGTDVKHTEKFMRGLEEAFMKNLVSVVPMSDDIQYRLTGEVPALWQYLEKLELQKMSMSSKR